MFCDKMDVEKLQKVLLSIFLGIVRLCFKKNSPRVLLQFFDFWQQLMLKNAKGSPFLALIWSNVLGFSCAVEENTLSFCRPFAIFEP